VSDRAQRSLGALLWAWLGSLTFLDLDYPVGDGDESLHALILTHMLQSGDYLHSYWQGALALQRPQLPYWLAAPFAAWIEGERGLRLSSALCSLGCLVVVYRTALAAWRRWDAAWLATLLLAGSASFHVYSRTLMSDPPFLLALCVALAGSLDTARPRRALYLIAIGLGLATASKSLAVAVPAVALLPGCVRTLRAAGGWRALGGPLALLVALALPYYLLGFALHGRLFWEEHFLFNLVKRATSGYGLGLQGGLLAYAQWIPLADGALGAGWLVLGSVGALGVGLWRRDAALALSGSFACVVFVLMSLLAMRLPHYVLPAYLGAALGVAGLWVHATDALGALGAGAGSQPLGERLRPLAVLLGLCLALLALDHPGGSPYLLQRTHGKELGVLAKKHAPAGRPIYAYEWYGPSLALYAERKAIVMTADQAFYRGVHFDVIERADAARLVPPAPEPVGSELWIAAEADVLARTAWLSVVEVVGKSPPYQLVRARVISAQ
jgi:4-amino-4-deoxy-L-arabinose transferase-like glycosyltransferase